MKAFWKTTEFVADILFQENQLRTGTDRHYDDWVPTLRLGHRKQGPRDSKAKNERAQRAVEKRRRDLSRIDQEKQQVEANVKKLNESGEPIRNISFS